MELKNHTIIALVLERSANLDSLVGSIAEWIGEAIIEGRLHPGDDLNSHDLAKQFNTSRTPVREALLLLEKEGLVTIPPRRRPYVTGISLEEVRDIYQVRANLLMLVSELIVTTASDEAITSLNTYLPQMQAAAASHDIDAYFWANTALRDAEMMISENVQVKRILDSLGLRTMQLRHLSLSQPGRLEQSLLNRQLQVKAYQERDAPLAMALARSTVLGALAAIERSGWTGFQQEKDHATALREPG